MSDSHFRGENGRLTKRAHTRRVLAVLPGAVVLVAAVLRLYRLGRLSFWYDEATTIILSRDLLALPTSLSTSAPLSFAIAHFWNALGTSEFWVRLWPALIGIAVVPLVFVFGRRLFSRRAGLIAAALVAISPLCIYYSQELRAYSLLPFLVVVAGYAWHKAAVTSRGRWLYVGIAAVALALSFYSHYCAALWIVSLPISVLSLSRTSRELLNNAKLSILVLGGSFILVAPWLLVFIEKARATVFVADFWIPKPGLETLLVSLKNMSAGFTAPSVPGYLAAGLVVLMIVIGLVCAAHHSRDRELRFVAINALLPMLLAFSISHIAKNSVYLDRCLIPSGLFLLMMAAYGISVLRKEATIAVLFSMLLLTSFSLVNLYRNIIPDISDAPGVRPRKSFRQACEFLSARLSPADIVGHTCRSSYAPFVVYLPSNIKQVVLASSREHRARVMQKYPYKGLWERKQGADSLPIAVFDLPVGYRRLILVESVWDIGRDDFYHGEMSHIRRYLDANYPHLESRDFYGAPLRFYDLTRPLSDERKTHH
ncbi:glycosyltransferase family 39 protein [bacterium]|nr:glycosyltransferase family 39 protein [bacterium]